MEELEKFRHVQDEVENLLSDYSHEGPMQEARHAIILEGLAHYSTISHVKPPGSPRPAARAGQPQILQPKR